MAPRSRSGCLTCRSRKLKCSEERPVCAQCLKANRECIPSSGITFRHQQNPSMNGNDKGDGSLKSFYGYKETFAKETTWVTIPTNLTFIHTSNPYEDEEGEVIGDTAVFGQPADFNGSRTEPDFSLSQTSYPAYATHGLEALSAVASQDQYSYGPTPQATMDQHDSTASMLAQAATSISSPEAIHAPTPTMEDVMLSSSHAPSDEANIDPRLDIAKQDENSTSTLQMSIS